MANHDWSETDDIAALYVYRFGAERLGTTVTDLARSRDIKPGSFRMRVQNFQALDGKGGLGNRSDQSARVFRLYGNVDEDILRQLVSPTARPAKP